MLLWLVDQFAAIWPHAAWIADLNGFTKITFRTALAALAGFLIAVVTGPRVIRWLRTRFREPPCQRVPQLSQVQQQKAWTPTMGGLFLVGGIVLAMLLLGNWQNSYLPIVLTNLMALAAIGAVDDLHKLSGRGPGLRPRAKLAVQLAVAFVIALWLYFVQRQQPGGCDLQLPFASHTIPLGWLFVPLAMLVLVGSSNSVNLTDGLDGLAGGCLLTSTVAMAVMAYLAGHSELARYLGIIHVPQAGEIVVLAGAMIGGTLGFLWFNCQPAQVFMGNIGALSLGGTLGVMAIIARQELLLLLVGGIFVIEALSVMLQMASYRWRGRRVFRCAPLHHHFQLLGWAENKIVVRFWIISALCALLGLGALKLNISENSASQSAIISANDRSPPASLANQPSSADPSDVVQN